MITESFKFLTNPYGGSFVKIEHKAALRQKNALVYGAVSESRQSFVRIASFPAPL